MLETQEIQVRSVGREDPLEEGMGIHSSILAQEIRWAEEPGELQSMCLQRVGHDWAHARTIILLGIHTKETKIERDTCTPVFIAALFTTARTWKQPRCPSADEWIRKLWYIYTMEYYLAIKKNTFESMLMRWMKLEPIIRSEVSQSEKH